MLHLAQVAKNPTSGNLELQLLAFQKAESTWSISNSDSLPLDAEHFLLEGLLVLVELGENRQILKIQEAKDWVVGLIQQYLTSGAITPEFIQSEQARVEQWRQEITVQNLELTRRFLEIETRRDQLQELETNLKQEKEELETRWQKLKELEANFKRERDQFKPRENSEFSS
ncbi:MAG: hypothetical protein ACREPR_03260 [Brasilonema sp.]